MWSRNLKSCASHKAQDRDWLAVCIVAPIVLYSAAILLLPLGGSVRDAAARRFHLSGWPFAAWALFQPLPSMYNFENRWDVTFTTRARTAPADDCGKVFHAFINHHVFNRVLLHRALLERCGLPAIVRFQTRYRGTTVETHYRLIPGPNTHGFIVTLHPE